MALVTDPKTAVWVPSLALSGNVLDCAEDDTMATKREGFLLKNKEPLSLSLRIHSSGPLTRAGTGPQEIHHSRGFRNNIKLT